MEARVYLNKACHNFEIRFEGKLYRYQIILCDDMLFPSRLEPNNLGISSVLLQILQVLGLSPILYLSFPLYKISLFFLH